MGGQHHDVESSASRSLKWTLLEICIILKDMFNASNNIGAVSPTLVKPLWTLAAVSSIIYREGQGLAS